MRTDQTETVRDVAAERVATPQRLKRLPQRGTTKQMHKRLLRVLGADRRVKRAFH